MTGEQLREELERIASGAPDVEVPGDLFARGRRATMRARAIAGAAAVACLALVAAVTVPLFRSEDPVFSDRDHPEGGVPDVIYAPTDGSRPGLPVVPLDEVGPVAAAYVADEIDPQLVAVTADGSYRLIELDDLYEPALADVSPRLSPDGRRLAYSADTDRGRSITIVDLVTGQTTDVAVGPSLGVALRSMQWSPDGRWLGWSGQAVKSRTASSASYRQRIIGGVIGPDDTSRALPHRKGGGWDWLGVCDDGTVLTYVWPVYSVTDGGRTDRERSWRRIVDEHGQCSAPAAVVGSQVDPQARLLGWLPTEDGARVPTAVVATPDWEDDNSYGSASLQLVSPGDEADTVGSVASVATEELTVATGLMSADDPTVPAGESPWEESWWERSRLPLAVLAVLVLGGGLVAWRVRRPVRG